MINAFLVSNQQKEDSKMAQEKSRKVSSPIPPPYSDLGGINPSVQPYSVVSESKRASLPTSAAPVYANLPKRSQSVQPRRLSFPDIFQSHNVIPVSPDSQGSNLREKRAGSQTEMQSTSEGDDPVYMNLPKRSSSQNDVHQQPHHAMVVSTPPQSIYTARRHDSRFVASTVGPRKPSESWTMKTMDYTDCPITDV